MLLLLHASGLLWWSYSATFMCYEYSVRAAFIFYNCMFVPEKGVELWLYSWTVVFVPEKGWKSGYSTGKMFMYYGWAIFMFAISAWKYSWLIGTFSRQPKTMAKVGHGLGLDEIKLQLRWLNQPLIFFTVAWLMLCAYATYICIQMHVTVTASLACVVILK